MVRAVRGESRCGPSRMIDGMDNDCSTLIVPALCWRLETEGANNDRTTGDLRSPSLRDGDFVDHLCIDAPEVRLDVATRWRPFGVVCMGRRRCNSSAMTAEAVTWRSDGRS